MSDVDQIVSGLLDDCLLEFRALAAHTAGTVESDRFAAFADRCAAARRLLIETHEGNVTHATAAAARGVLP